MNNKKYLYLIWLFILLTNISQAQPLTNEQLLDTIQRQTLKYFWDYAHPDCGLAHPRWKEKKSDIITTGGSGFGIMALVVGVDRGILNREEVVDRLLKACNFLQNKATRYHGAWAHWIYGSSGKTRPFSKNDDGADLIETSFLIAGLLTAKEYFDGNNVKEKKLRKVIQILWEEIEWDWFTKEGTEEVLYWHWSPNYKWEKNLAITGWHEGMIAYVLAASSPTHPIKPKVYHNGWAKGKNFKNGKTYYNHIQPLGRPLGGPLFFAHYSFTGLDPRNLIDQYASYWEHNTQHTLINWSYCVDNPHNFEMYSDSCWGLTASDSPFGYKAHAPALQKGKSDNGTITPTAALSSIPYTPRQSLQAARWFWQHRDKIWGEYGFKDAFNPTQKDKNGDWWVAKGYIGIDQGPIVIMIENYRTGLIWDTFMKNKDIQKGLNKLDIRY